MSLCWLCEINKCDKNDNVNTLMFFTLQRIEQQSTENYRQSFTYEIVS